MNADDSHVLSQGKPKPRRSGLLFISSLVAAILLTILVRNPAFTPSQNYVLFLLFFSVGLWLTEAIPPFAVGLFIMAFLFFSLGNEYINPSPVETKKYVQTMATVLSGFY